MNMFGKAGPIAQSPAMQQLPWARPFNDFQAVASQVAGGGGGSNLASRLADMARTQQQPAQQQTLADMLRRRNAGGAGAVASMRAGQTLAGNTYGGVKTGG